ncbi:MAG: hypothetical protein GY733_15530 [bacterium]|nr:hypothetical protein [bacterium]
MTYRIYNPRIAHPRAHPYAEAPLTQTARTHSPTAPPALDGSQGPGTFRTLPIRANRIFYGLGLAMFALHFIHLSIYAVDIPFMDEWGGASFYPGLQQESLNWAFILAPHNAHRIVPTRLSYWALDHFADLNFATLALMNFALFAWLSWRFLKTLERSFEVPLGHFLVVFATAALYENHFWGFGGQFHFCLGFFLLALHAARSQGVYRFASPLFMAASMLSFGTGPIYGVALCGFFLALAWRGPRRIQSLALAATTAAMISLWFWTTPLSHHSLSTPLQGRYWRYLFDLLASGFGYDGQAPYVGGLLALLLLAGAGRLLWAARDPDAAQRVDQIALAALALGLVGGLASTSLGRAHMNSPKTSRYVELGIFLVPVLWLIVILVAKTLGQRLRILPAPAIAAAALALALLAPFANNFDYKKTYEPLFQSKQATAACIRRYLFYGGSPSCPIPYMRDITRHMQAAREAELLYTRKP